VIVAFDNTFLTLVLNPAAPPRPNPQTGKPASHCRSRIEALIDNLTAQRARVIVPAPVFAEALCATPDLQRLLVQVEEYQVIEVSPFDKRSAIELAFITRAAIAKGDKRDGVLADWQRVKFDRQIVAIAKANGASVIYTDDYPQTRFAELAGLAVKHTWDLPLPASHAQIDWIKEDDEADRGVEKQGADEANEAPAASPGAP
jgi:predicted nucleic acid-binding protein